MRLTSLHLTNFRQHADTRITFGSGITGIIGANGSGKSTLLEAIAWAIYGNPAARGTRETLRFNRAGGRASVRVELQFEVGRHHYRVVRGLTSAELYLDDAVVPIANSITGVTELLTRRLGMTREEFFNTYFTGQKELSVMAAMGPSDRAQFLSHVLGYERLRAAQTVLRARRSALVAEIAGLRQGMADPEQTSETLARARDRAAASRRQMGQAAARREAASSAFGAVAPRWAAAQQERDELQALLAELRVAEGAAAGLERDRVRLERELAELGAAAVERERLARELVPYAALHAEFQRLEILAREEGRREALSETRRALAEELTRLRERRDRVQTAPRLEREITAALAARRAQREELDAAFEARRTELVRDRQEAETKRDALRAQYVEIRAQRDRLAATGPEEPCPTCTRPLGASLRSVLELLDAQMETVLVDGNYYKARLEQLRQTPDDVRDLDTRRQAAAKDVTALEGRLVSAQLAARELAQLTADVHAKEQREAQLSRDLAAIPAGYDAARHAVVRGEIDRLLPLEQRHARLSAQAEREPLLQHELTGVRDSMADVSSHVAALQTRRENARLSEADFTSLRSAHEAAAAELREAELAAVAAEAESAASSAAVAAAEAAARELEERQRLLAELAGRKRLHDELDRAFTDLRTDLNFQLRPELSELASAFLVDLTDGRYTELELDDQYNVVVLEEGIAKPVISGGEEDLANLVLRLAISQMIAERAGQPFSLLILDEIFGSLDEAHRASVIGLLRRLQDRFEQVILITHIESVREQLDQVIAVRYDAESGASVVTAASGGLSDGVLAPSEAPLLARAAAGA